MSALANTCHCYPLTDPLGGIDSSDCSSVRNFSCHQIQGVCVQTDPNSSSWAETLCFKVQSSPLAASPFTLPKISLRSPDEYSKRLGCPACRLQPANAAALPESFPSLRKPNPCKVSSLLTERIYPGQEVLQGSKWATLQDSPNCPSGQIAYLVQTHEKDFLTFFQVGDRKVSTGVIDMWWSDGQVQAARLAQIDILTVIAAQLASTAAMNSAGKWVLHQAERHATFA